MDLRPCLLLVFFIVSGQAYICGEFRGCFEPSYMNCAGCGMNSQPVPDPFDCHKYLVCNQNHIAFNGTSFSCPDEEIFDRNSLKCERYGSCTEECPICRYTCNNGAGAVADPEDCSVYYECNGVDTGTQHTCPPTEPYFDGFRCQKDISQCCHCMPYCYGKDVNHVVGDPTDCRKFHGCTVEGAPTFSGECDPNEYFDVLQETCSASANCTTLCKNVIGSDGCIDPYTCQATGYFAKCPTQCVPEYYQCDAISDKYIDAIACTIGSVFHPDLLRCVDKDTCPY